MSDRGGEGRGGCGLGRVISDVIHTYIRQSHGVGQRLTGNVARTDAPVYMREQGGGGRGGCGLRSAISAIGSGVFGIIFVFSFFISSRSRVRRLKVPSNDCWQATKR